MYFVSAQNKEEVYAPLQFFFPYTSADKGNKKAWKLVID